MADFDRDRFPNPLLLSSLGQLGQPTPKVIVSWLDGCYPGRSVSICPCRCSGLAPDYRRSAWSNQPDCRCWLCADSDEPLSAETSSACRHCDRSTLWTTQNRKSRCPPSQRRPLPRGVNLFPMLALLLLGVLLLSLSIACKDFLGVFSTRNSHLDDSIRVFISQQGWSWSGNGLSGAIDAYVPFFGTRCHSLIHVNNNLCQARACPSWLPLADLKPSVAPIKQCKDARRKLRLCWNPISSHS